MLLMIRMRHTGMVDVCLDQGISATSQCCSGQIKSIFWDADKGRQKDDAEDDDADSGSDDEQSDTEKKPNTKEAPKKPIGKARNSLRAEYEYETPLSTAVSVENLDIVRRLLKAGANPLRCDDAAVRAGVKTVITREDKCNGFPYMTVVLFAS